MTNNATEATHLVMTRVARTVKLILALATVRHLVSSKWVSDSAVAGQFLPLDNYRLDPTTGHTAAAMDSPKPAATTSTNRCIVPDTISPNTNAAISGVPWRHVQ